MQRRITPVSPAFAALSEVLGRIAALEFWPGDRVTVFGEHRVYVRALASRLHLVFCEESGVEQVAPADSVRRSG